MQISVIKPEIFSNNDQVNAFFTLKNARLYNDKRNIKGLNVGFNTDENPEIITQNRRDLFDVFHIDPQWIAFANQVHSNRVMTVSGGGTFAETDALITQVPGLALAIQVADCAAILIADMQSNTVAAIHAGWRGAAGDIVPRTLEKMVQRGVKMENCKAFISPCISERKFEVGAEVADQFPAEFVNYERYEKPHINLKEFLAYQLQKNGLQKNCIEIHPGCTVEENQYYSYRRKKEKSGRMMGIIQLKEHRV